MKFSKFAEQWIAGHKIFNNDEFNGQLGDALLDFAIMLDEQNHTRESLDTLVELFRKMYEDYINPTFPQNENEISALQSTTQSSTL